MTERIEKASALMDCVWEKAHIEAPQAFLPGDLPGDSKAATGFPTLVDLIPAFHDLHGGLYINWCQDYARLRRLG